jgi:trigger factor
VFVLTFDISPEEFAKAVDAAYEKTKGNYAVQGFRKGKAPKRVLEGMYGKGLFYEDALDAIMQEAYEEALEKEALEPVERPDVDVTNAGENGAQFKITVTTLKPVKLGQYKGLTVKKAEAAVADDDVAAELEREREKAVRIINVDDRAAKNGDAVVIDFSGSVDGVKFEGGSAEKFELVLGSGSFIPGFEAQVEGMTLGGEKDVCVRFPDDYQADNLKGKDAVFAVKLHEIKFNELPALDDEFAKDVSQFDTLAEFKDDIRKRLQEKKNEAAKNADEKTLVEKIVETSDFEVPSTFIEREAAMLVRQFEYGLMYKGLKLKDYYKYTGTAETDLLASYKDAAAKNVSVRMILEEIIKAESIVPDQEKLDERLTKLAEKAGKTLEEYKKTIEPSEYDYYVNELLTDAVFGFLFANNKFE